MANTVTVEAAYLEVLHKPTDVRVFGAALEALSYLPTYHLPKSIKPSSFGIMPFWPNPIHHELHRSLKIGVRFDERSGMPQEFVRRRVSTGSQGAWGSGPYGPHLKQNSASFKTVIGHTTALKTLNQGTILAVRRQATATLSADHPGLEFSGNNRLGFFPGETSGAVYCDVGGTTVGSSRLSWGGYPNDGDIETWAMRWTTTAAASLYDGISLFFRGSQVASSPVKPTAPAGALNIVIGASSGTTSTNTEWYQFLWCDEALSDSAILNWMADPFALFDIEDPALLWPKNLIPGSGSSGAGVIICLIT